MSYFDKSKEEGVVPSEASSERTVVIENAGITSKGRIAGGKYLENVKGEAWFDAEGGPLTTVGIDLPLTLLEKSHHHAREVLILSFAAGDMENPFNWSRAKKRFITWLLCLMTLFIGLATTSYSSGIDSMCEEFGAPVIMGQLGLFLFNVVCALGPLFLAPFCEMAGRRVVYVGAFAGFAVMFIGLALGRNMATILVCRALLGLFGSVGTILVGGTFSDMYVPEERARPMALFAWIAILGTVGAPIYAGFIDMTLGWRWIEGIQGIANVPLLVVVAVGLPETRGRVALTKRARALREATGDARYVARSEVESTGVPDMLRQSSVKAIHMLVTEPVVMGFGLWIAFTWFLVFLFLSAIPITFGEVRGWNEGVAGLPYISLCVGVTLGYVGNFCQMRQYESIRRDPDRQLVPEDRLYGAMLGGIWLPVGLFMYSFTQYGQLPWIAPAISLAPIAFGIFFIFESVYSVTADCYGEHASSAIAGQGFLRNALGAVSPLFASQMFHGMGSQYAGLLLALVATALGTLPFIMYRYGHILRSRSRLAQTF